MIDALALSRRSGLYFLVSVALLGALAWPVLLAYDSGREQTQLARERGYLDITERMVQTELLSVIGDARVLARAARVQEFLAAPEAARASLRAALESQLGHVAQTYQRYGQLRLLDLAGQELVRVDYREGRLRVVPAAALQNKADRYYFSATAALGPGQFHVSPLDLNVDNGRLELPHVPMIRVGVAVFDEAGQRRGVLVLNYHAQGMLDSFRATMAQSGLHQGMLLNAEGQWLSNHSRANEWGWMLGRPENNFAGRYPEIWRAMGEPLAGGSSTGEWRDAAGVYLYRTIYPLKFRTEHLPHAASAQGLGSTLQGRYRWHLVTFVPKEAWLAESLLRQPAGLWSLAGALLLLALASVALAAQRLGRQTLLQERLRNARELEELYEFAPCGYHSLDAQGLVVRMNATELAWLGYTREEVVGKLRYADLVAPESREELQRRFQGSLQGENLQDLQITMRRRDGSIFPVAINAATVRNTSGEFLLSRTTMMDITERRRLEQALEHEARTDSLTGVYNRRHFHALGERELARSGRQGTQLCLLMIDIDHFKRINDQYGHAVGDAAIKAMTGICTEQLRATDVFARVGGEEFAALLPDTDLPAATYVANRLRMALERLVMPLQGHEEPLRFTISIGVALNAAMNISLDVLLMQADTQLYRAKESGRNRVC